MPRQAQALKSWIPTARLKVQRYEKQMFPLNASAGRAVQMACQLLSTAELSWSAIKIHNKEIHRKKKIFFQLISNFAMGCCHGPVGKMRGPHTCREQDLKVQSTSVHEWGGFSSSPQDDILNYKGQSRASTWPWCDKGSKGFPVLQGLRCPLSTWCERERQEPLPPYPARTLLPGLWSGLGYCTRHDSRCRRVL